MSSIIQGKQLLKLYFQPTQLGCMQLDEKSSDSNLVIDPEMQQKTQIKQIQMFNQICKQLKTGLKTYLRKRLESIQIPREKNQIIEFNNNMRRLNIAKCLQFCVLHTISPRDFVDNIRSAGQLVTTIQQFRVTAFFNQFVSYGTLILKFNQRFKLQDITQDDWFAVFQQIQNRVQWIHCINGRFVVIAANGLNVKAIKEKVEEESSPIEPKKSVSDQNNDQNLQENDLQVKDEFPETVEVTKSTNIYVADYTQNNVNDVFAQLSGDFTYDVIVCGTSINESELQRLSIRSLQYNVKSGIKLTLRYPRVLKMLSGHKLRITNLNECDQLRNLMLVNGKIHARDLKDLKRLEKFVCNGVEYTGDKNSLVQMLVEIGAPLEYLSLVRCTRGVSPGTFSNDALRRLTFVNIFEAISKVESRIGILKTIAEADEPGIEVKDVPATNAVQFDEKKLICGRQLQSWKLWLFMFVIPVLIAFNIKK